MLSCLLLCFCKERNNKSFEDREKTLEELKFVFSNTLYLWTTAIVSPFVLGFQDFLALFSSFS
jgi:hypothetical protein